MEAPFLSTAAGAASLMQDPPSPNMMGAAGPKSDLLGAFSVDKEAETDRTWMSRRLRSIARYEHFRPQAVACSLPLSTSLLDTHNDVSCQLTPRRSTGTGKTVPNRSTGSSLLALAGSNGIVLSRVARPQAPLAVLSHATSSAGQTGSISCLAFQPKTTESLLLAAGRGCGVLVWDASGHSLSPLLGRLGVDTGSSLSPDLRITSLDWKRASLQPFLAMTTSHSASLWDLRTSLGSSPSRPAIRFGRSRNATSPLIQISCSDLEECATLDAAGVVRIYDMRKDGELNSFASFGHAGVGLTFLPTTTDGTAWMAWGLDAPFSSAIVKIWSDRQVQDTRAEKNDDDSDLSSEQTPVRPSATTDSPQSAQKRYRQIAQFSTPRLACARACPEPFLDQIVTVGVLADSDGETSSSGWQVDLWKLDASKEESNQFIDTVGVEKKLSFQGGPGSDKQLELMIGATSKIGPLRGAELALHVSEEKNGVDTSGASSDVELQLCCLSGGGYVASYAVMDDFEPSSKRKSPTRLVDPRLSPLRGTPHPQRHVSVGAKFFPDGTKDSSVLDAATALRTWAEPLAGPFSDVLTKDGQESPVTPTKQRLNFAGAVPQEDVSNSIHHAAEASMTQFHVDIPTAYRKASGDVDGIGISELTADDNIVANSAVVISNDIESVEVGLQQGFSIVSQIEKDRVPCPRLCGATFSAGIGAIICFQNGEVKKMWSWYQRTDVVAKRRTHVFGASGTVQPQRETDSSSSALFATHEPLSRERIAKLESPRTLQDLEDMMSAAKKAQWNEIGYSETSSDEGSESSIENIFDDSSDDSDSLPSGNFEDQDGTPTKQNVPDARFGIAEKVAAEKDRAETAKTEGGNSTEVGSSSVLDRFGGPSSDFLAPIVYISHQKVQAVFNFQCTQLAEGWMLGEWYSAEKRFNEVRMNAVEDERNTGLRGKHRSQSMGLFRAPRIQDVGASQISQVRSDPMLDHLTPKSPGRRKAYGVAADEEAVRAGEYSVRPDEKESRVFLLKIFQHQNARSHTLMSPPDSPLLPKKTPSSPRMPRVTSSDAILQKPHSIAVDPPLVDPQQHPLGVTIISSRTTTVSQNVEREFYKRQNAKTKEICLHNANVCFDVGQPEKGDVWTVLAQMVDSILSYEGDDYNGWGGPCGGALGQGLVLSMLDYYETQGDVQMLSTMVCVLGRGDSTSDRNFQYLLPSQYRERYEGYIRRYADVLYAWGLLTKRAELNKHLIHALPAVEAQQLEEETTASAGTPGVAVVVVCPRCSKDTQPGSNVCRTCGDFAFRCTICNNAVRGLFTVCPRCGHGGHMNHLKPWFSKHTQCPSGCGCECVMSEMLIPQVGVNGISESPMLHEGPVQPSASEDSTLLLPGGVPIPVGLQLT